VTLLFWNTVYIHICMHVFICTLCKVWHFSAQCDIFVQFIHFTVHHQTCFITFLKHTQDFSLVGVLLSVSFLLPFFPFNFYHSFGEIQLGCVGKYFSHQVAHIYFKALWTLGLPGWAVTALDFTEARNSEWQWNQLGHMQICTWPQTDATPHHSVFYRPDALPAAEPTSSKHWRHQATFLINLPSARVTRVFNYFWYCPTLDTE